MKDDRFLFVKESEDSYVMFLPPDMQSVRLFRRELTLSLERHSFSREDIQQIELACDEALTNSISANVNNKSDETIICRWKIQSQKFTLILLDYGKGVPPEKINPTKRGPSSLNEVMDKFKQMQEESPRILPFSGVQKSHKNMGQGLRIITKLMDTVKIMYHGGDNTIRTNLEEGSNIDGSIMELEYYSKKK
jgi:anti-sigma regulatory factor (Ser/Thr protein kinase)